MFIIKALYAVHIIRKEAFEASKFSMPLLLGSFKGRLSPGPPSEDLACLNGTQFTCEKKSVSIFST